MMESGHVYVFFGALGDLPGQGPPLNKGTEKVLSDVLLLGAIAVALLLALMVWAIFLRKTKPKRRLTGGQKVYSDSESDTPEQTSDAVEEPADTRRRYKFRYRRRRHRSRNPTLAETGGLPANRPEESGEHS